MTPPATPRPPTRHRSSAVLAVLTAITLAASACGYGTVSRDQFAQEQDGFDVDPFDQAPTGFPTVPDTAGGADQGAGELDGTAGELGTEATGGGQPGQPQPAPAIDIFASAPAVVDDLRTVLGGNLRPLEIVLYPTYSYAEVQSPANPAHVDRYFWRDGTWTGPEPVRTHSGMDIEADVFAAEGVALDQVPQLVARTLEVLAIEGGEPTHVIVERNTPFDEDVVMRVYVNGPRTSGRIDYHADGSEKRVYAG